MSEENEITDTSDVPSEPVVEIDPELRKWYDDDNEFDLRYSFNLDNSSVVFDIGGYDGYWSKIISDRYEPNIYLFEPAPEFYEKITEALSPYPKIQCFNYGVSGSTCKHILFLQGDGTSVFVFKNDPSESVICQLISIDEILTNLNIQKIDLMKINAEGIEFEILERMIQLDLMKNVKTLLVQFHEFVRDAENRKQNIEHELGKTHALTFDYGFIWQKWDLL